MQPHPDAGCDVERTTERHREHEAHGFLRVGSCAQGLESLAPPLFRGALVQVGGVLRLDHRRIPPHDAREIPGRRRAVDIAAESGGDDGRDVAAVIDVRMTEHERVGVREPVRHLSVGGVRLRPAARDDEPVTRSGDAVRGAEEFEVHAATQRIGNERHPRYPTEPNPEGME